MSSDHSNQAAAVLKTCANVSRPTDALLMHIVPLVYLQDIMRLHLIAAHMNIQPLLWKHVL